MIKRFFILLLAIVASVGMSWATTTDLASITDNYTAQDGEILTGTLGVNVKISIADGATVTLLNANINGDKTWTTGDYAGLTCLGDATITIVGTNSVSGFSTDNGYPGIYVPSGKTLIINGTGSLTARSSTAEAAGIGAGRTTHCGNIEIQSGKITAIAGGEEGAGIGGGFNADCGNITISGGIVTAVGGDYSAGIGGGKRSGSTNAGHCGNILISGGVVSATSGKQAAAIGGGRGNNNAYKSNCGTITITNTALKVYAEQGGEKGSTNTIGAGKYNNCGTVTIGGNTGVINDDPYTYRTKEDGEIVVVYIASIGTVVYTQECKDKIDIARELYDALEDSQKTLVTNYQTLLDAEAAYAALIPQPAADPIPCTAADRGKVLCTDGSIYATVSEATAASKTAAAVIAYVDTENAKALALALADDGGTMEWATAKTTAPAHTPAVSGGTWTLASKDDWNNMITAAGSYTALRDGFSGVGGTNMQQDKYWSSTPENANAWCYYFNYGMWTDGYVDNPCRVRACLTFDIPAAPAYETVMNLINEIPNPVELTAECKAKIDAARTAYDALSAADKDLVTNIATLTTAETDYAALAAAAAAPVIAQIEALPTTIKLSTYFSTYDLMVAARAAYNALSAEVQAAVTNLSKLTNLEAAFAAIGGANEKLSKPFSVGAEQVVYFSHGNLQATYNGSNWSWAFAAHQYDYIGDTSGNIIINGNGTLSGAGTVDLFGWVANSSTVLTSGVAKYGVSNSDNVVDYGLGTTETLKGDWGVAANDANIGGYNDWRILSNDEWVYLFKTRTDAASKYGYATVGGVNGVIIIPDAFTDPMKNKGNLAFRPQNVDKGYSTNVYTTGGNWEAMEAAGAVFMPAAGRRAGTAVTINEGTGFYWSSTPMSYQASYFMGFMGSNVVPDNDRYRYHGLSVRLVSNNAPVASTPLDSALVVKDMIEAIPAEITLEDACVKAINDAREAYNKLSEAAKGLLDEATIAKLTDAEAALTALYQVEADKVVAKINNIPTPVTLKLATRDSIESARAAYEALNAEQKLLVSNIDVLTAAEATMATLNPGGGAPSTELQGDGSTENPYLIGGLEAWNAFADAVAAGVKPANAKLTNNIEGVTRMVGNFTNYYTGVFDGNGFTITMNIETNLDSAGLFRCVKEATFMNLNLEGTLNTSRKFAGSLVGAQLSINTLVIKNVCSSVAMTLSLDGDLTSGGIVGLRLGTIQITDCLFKGSMTSTGGGSMCGGIVGYSSSNLTLVRVIQAGTYNLNTSSYDGVFVRNNDANLNAQNCYYINGVGGQSTCAAATKITTDQLNTQTYVDLLQTGKEETYWVLKDGVLVWNHHETSSPSPLDSAQVVKDLIEAIPMPVTLEDVCVNAIQAARDAYNALTEATKGALDDATVQKLNQAITDYTALIQAGADAVKAKIAAIPQPIELKLSVYDMVLDARAAYDALTADQKALVTNYQTLLDAEAAFDAIGGGGGLPTGALPGAFSVGKSNAICFSQGNLQATTADLGANWTWSFAANQWDYIGNAVANTAISDIKSVSTNGTVDLFGWSTAATYYGISNNPGAAYYTGDFIDWGTNAISNGGNTANAWHTLAHDEWDYLFNTRTTTSGIRYAKATVNGIPGIILLPDDWSATYYALSNTNDYEVDFNSNVITTSDWTNSLEANGAVFLPAAGERVGADVSDVGSNGHYWSSTFKTEYNAYCVSFNSYDMDASDYINRRQGYSVRLVVAAPVNYIAEAQAALALINAIPDTITLDAACVNAIQSARAAVTALGENASLIDASDMTKLTDAEAALTALNQAEADKVIAKINNIPTPIELKLATRDSIESARAAYEALNADQKALVPAAELQKLLDAEAALEALNPGGSVPVDIVWDGNTGIANVDPNTTSPAYEGMTVTVGAGSSFSTYQSRLYFTFYSQPNGGYIFANENGTNITKVVIESTTALTSTMTEVDRMGSGWVISNENKTATWTGNADSVSIWKGQSFTNYWVVDTITFTVNGVGATPLDSAQHVKDLIDAIPDSIVYPTSGPAIAAALVAYNQLSDAAKGALDAADVQKMTDAATLYAAMDAIAAIENIPDTITYDPLVKAAIENARDKYDALIDASKALVSAEVLHKLTNAEEAWAILVAKIEHNVSYIGKDGELKHETVALLHIPDPAPEFNGYEFVRWDVKAGDFLEEGLRIKAVYTPIITTKPVAYDSLMYNGTAQTLITAGVAKEGHIEYRINDGAWSAELPKATFAAAYVVYYKLVREGHADYIADSIVSIIAKAPVVYTAPTAVDSLVYNAANQTLIAAGTTADGTFEYSLDPTLLDSWNTELPKAMTAGIHNVYYRVQGDLNHLDSTAVDPIAVTIAKAALTATADDKNVIYGDAVPAYTVTYAGWQGDDDTTALAGQIAYTCTYAPTSNVGEYPITPSGVSAANYNITFVNGKVTVAKATLTVTAENKTVTYGDTIPVYTATYSGWKNSDDASVVSNLAYTCAYAPTSNVGEYPIVPSGATATNYTFAYVNGKVTVNQAALMITAEDKNVIYGDAVPTYTATYSGWKNGDEASVVTGLVYTCAYAPTSNVGEYTITPSGATATNYAISFTNGKVTVAKAALTITAEDKNVIYGDAVPTYTATYSGWKNADTESVVTGLAYTCEYAPTSNVGNYTITPNSATATNYAISFVNGKVTVAQATLTVTAENKTVTYGDAVPTYTATYSGFKNSDDASVVDSLAYTCEYAVTSNVGNYTITPNSATALNYTFVYVNGTLTVNQAALMITAEDKNVIYGDAVPTYTATYSGWKNSDTESVVTGLVYTCAYAPTSNVGTYTITPSGATATNYAISFTNGKVTVNQAALMITAEDKNVIYGDAVPTYTATYSGWKNGDTESVVTGLVYTCEYAVTSNVGEYTIVPSDATATNYAISFTNGKVTVAKAELTITANDTTMIYGDEHPEFTASYSGWKNADTESVVTGLAYTTPYKPGSPIGTYTINPNSASAQNYAITFVDGTLTVVKAVVSVSGAEAQTAKFADGHANAVVLNQGQLNGVKLQDAVGHVTTAAFSTADVAEHLTITLFYELTGDAALLNNYDLQPTSEVFTTEGVIIEPFIPDTTQTEEQKEEQTEVQEGIDVYAYGYCDGSGYSLKYHLNTGNPDQYKIDFADSRFTDVPWTDLDIAGKDGTIDIDIPVDMPTGDYSMTVYFRDSRFTWLESQALTVTFHVNLPETYVQPLFDNTIVLIDTCECFTDIQWYYREDSSQPWEPIPGATGHYYHADGKLTGEYFVQAKMNGVPTYTCGQDDMNTLYGGGQQAKVSAYPNPVLSTTTVTIENSANNEHQLRVVNLMGIEMLNTTFDGDQTIVDMSGYVTGNYMITVDGVAVKVMKK